MMWVAPLILIGTLTFFAAAFLYLQHRFPQDPSPLIDKIDDLLPQTQCAQCGYAGCRPYAEAITEGVALNLCPPGGVLLIERLSDLMGAPDALAVPREPEPLIAFINESKCIGCTLCLPPCPVDAILGAQNKMHTVLISECTGCELCVPACPVDCIELHPAPAAKLEFVRTPRTRKEQYAATEAPISSTDQKGILPRACIHCGLCNPACPIDLSAQELLLSLDHGQLPLAAEQGLANCIECEICDRVCPSDIPLAKIFADGKITLAESAANDKTRARFKAKFTAHELRHRADQDSTMAKRAARLSKSDRWS